MRQHRHLAHGDLRLDPKYGEKEAFFRFLDDIIWSLASRSFSLAKLTRLWPFYG